MRALLVGVMIAAILSLFGSAALQAAGDVGPGTNGSAYQLAGDVGPGTNGSAYQLAGDVGPGTNG